MRNASKNTIKRVMCKAKHDQEKHNSYFFHPDYQKKHRREMDEAYFLFNNVGAQIYRMSKGKICNRSLAGLSKYYCL